ncbi:hypothetical protein RB200_36165 [Streptomyces sp. PmtG]
MPDRFAIGVKVRGLGLALAVVRDLRDVRPPATAEELDRFESDELAGFVLARAPAGLADGTIPASGINRTVVGAEIDQGPAVVVAARVSTRFSYSRRASRCAGIAAAP